MSDVTQQIKDKLDIVDFLKGYIDLLPAGRNYRAVCPFHKEKTPSFMVSADRGMWHCFGGCNEGGDIFSFLMKFENIDFYEALQILAEKTGIDLKKSAGGAEFNQYGILYEINAAARDFFKNNLNEAALTYYQSRGLTRETITEFDLGFSPPSSAGNADQLLRFLLNKGFAIQEIEKAGLIFRTERGNYMDRFRARYMFPICNAFGKVVGFTGRIMPEYEKMANVNLGKYVNSPETPVFNKSKVLYGLNKSKNHIKDAGSVLLVEGQMDFLMTY